MGESFGFQDSSEGLSETVSLYSLLGWFDPINPTNYKQTHPLPPQPLSPASQTQSISEVYFWHPQDIPWQWEAGSSAGEITPGGLLC